MTVKRSKGKVRFTTPNSETELEIFPGKDGKPIRTMNLHVPWLQNMVQYKSIINKYDGGKRSWEFSGTNGVVSKVEAKGEI